MRLPLLALAGLCLAACQPESDKTNPAIATDDNVAAREATGPAVGANSFTEQQARDRLIAAGYADVSGLTLGEDGLWRGSATVAGQTQEVSLDYQGIVTSTASPMTPGAAPPPGTPTAPTGAPTTPSPTEPTP